MLSRRFSFFWALLTFSFFASTLSGSEPLVKGLLNITELNRLDFGGIPASDLSLVQKFQLNRLLLAFLNFSSPDRWPDWAKNEVAITYEDIINHFLPLLRKSMPQMIGFSADTRAGKIQLKGFLEGGKSGFSVELVEKALSLLGF
jgi:hypothetical protein